MKIAVVGSTGYCGRGFIFEDDFKLLNDAFLVPIGPIHHHKDFNIRAHIFSKIRHLKSPILKNNPRNTGKRSRQRLRTCWTDYRSTARRH